MMFYIFLSVRRQKFKAFIDCFTSCLDNRLHQEVSDIIYQLRITMTDFWLTLKVLIDTFMCVLEFFLF